MVADRQLWCQMADLVNLHAWTLDDAFTEYTEVQGDMASLLQARWPFRGSQIFRWASPASRGQGQRGGKGGAGAGGQANQPGAKITKFEDKGKSCFLCRDYSSAKGCSFTAGAGGCWMGRKRASRSSRDFAARPKAVHSRVQAMLA